MTRLISRLLLAGLIATVIPGCKSDKPDEPPPVKTIRDQSADTAFQSFMGMLLKAIDRKDKVKLAQLMSPDFGYSYPDGEGIEGAFKYWDQNNLWPQLRATAAAGFAPAGAYMVAPPEFAIRASEYQG